MYASVTRRSGSGGEGASDVNTAAAGRGGTSGGELEASNKSIHI